jgi:hypothetical protein
MYPFADSIFKLRDALQQARVSYTIGFKGKDAMKPTSRLIDKVQNRVAIISATVNKNLVFS